MYTIYGLIDPRTNKLCYIGQTKRKLTRRLYEHNHPKVSNRTKIAKLCRHLDKKGLTFSIIILETGIPNIESCNLSEIRFISEYKPVYKLYNEQEGGNASKHTEESIKKMMKTRSENGVWYTSKGSNHGASVIDENTVLQIYDLIKMYYSNAEIIRILNLPLKSNAVTSIRNGINWKHLWIEHFSEPIPTVGTLSSGLSFRLKLKLIDLIHKGFAIDHILSHINRVNRFDLGRVKRKEIWKFVWECYFKFYTKYPKHKPKYFKA